MTATPSNDGYVAVTVNGVEATIGDGVRSYDCYFADAHPFTRVAAGNSIASALKNRNAWAWGTNTNGAVGDGTTTNRSSPTSVVGAHSFIALGVNTEGQHAMAIKPDGSAWDWGLNTSGQLGDNSATNRSSPVSVVGAHSFLLGAVGSAQTGAIKADGTCWTWGSSTSGALGDNTTTAKSSPVSVVGAHSFVAIGAGVNFMAGLKADGTCWGWGSNSSGRLGNKSIAAVSSPISVFGNHSFVAMTLGFDHMLAIKQDGSCWGWGDNSDAGLGDNTTTNRSSPVSVVGNHSFKAVATAIFHSLALKADGSAWTWGDVTQIVGTISSSPVSVVGAHSFVAIAAGQGSTSFGLKNDGTIWSWGNSNTGQDGTNGAAAGSSPVVVAGHPANTVRLISAIQAGDFLVWNGPIAGFDLGTADFINFNYNV